MIGFNHLGIVGRLGNQMFQYDFIIMILSFLKVTSMDEWNDHQLFEVFKLPNLKNRGKISDKYLQERQFHFDQELVDQLSR